MSFLGFGSSDKKKDEEKLIKTPTQNEEKCILKNYKAIESTPEEILDKLFIIEYKDLWDMMGKSDDNRDHATRQITRIVYKSSMLYFEDCFGCNDRFKFKTMHLMWECNGSAIIFTAPIKSGSDDEKKILEIFKKVENIPVFKEIRPHIWTLNGYAKILKEIKEKRAERDKISLPNNEETSKPLIDLE